MDHNVFVDWEIVVLVSLNVVHHWFVNLSKISKYSKEKNQKSYTKNDVGRN
jgi:hypothetical protein